MSSDKKKGGRMIDPNAQKPPRVIDPYSQDSLPTRSDAARKTEKGAASKKKSTSNRA
jgi:hypothetical protein